MNIFAVSKDPNIAAQVLPDKLIVKMPLETAQMLSTAVIQHRPSTVTNKTYKTTYRYAHLSPWLAFWCREQPVYNQAYRNHPCTKWAYTNRSNFLWLCEHGLSLAEEYTNRYGKIHKSQTIIEKAIELEDCIPEGPLTNFAQAMDTVYTHPTDHTIAYKRWVTSKSYFVGGYKKGRDFTSFFSS